MNFNNLNTTHSFKTNRVLLYNTSVINVLTYATRCITTHFSFTTICIKHSHSAVSYFTRHNKYNTVRTNTKMSVTHSLSELFWVSYFFFKTVNVYIVISTTVDFSKFHIQHLIFNIFLQL